MAVDAAAMADATVQAETPAAPVEATAEDTAAAAEAAFWARLEGLDPDEVIRKAPRIQGKVGALAQQQGQKAEREAEARYQQALADAREAARIANERETRVGLAKSDPDALAAKVLADEAAAEYREQQDRLLEAQRGEMSRSLAAKLDAFHSKAIFREAWDAATPEQRSKLSWTNYREIDDFFEAAAEVISDHRAEKKADALAAKRLEALKKDAGIEGIKAEAAGGRADLNLDGMSTGEHIFSQSEIQANIGNAAWRKANISKINQQAAAGLIRND